MSISNILFIYGPAGCGKTTNKERFLKHYTQYSAIYEHSEFADNQTRQRNNCIVLTTEDNLPSEVTRELLGWKIKPFQEAMDDSQPAVQENSK